MTATTAARDPHALRQAPPGDATGQGESGPAAKRIVVAYGF